MKCSKLISLVTCGLIFIASAVAETGSHTLTNDELWNDKSGNAIQAHDDVIKVGSKYYWYGMDYSHNIKNGDGNGFRAVKCYESTDLVNWTFKNNVLTSTSSDLLNVADIKNPQVVYNPNTGNYVMWLTYNTSSTLNNVLVAFCDKPYGNFRVYRSRFAINDGSVANSLYVDETGQGYVITFARDDGDDTWKTFIYGLNNEYSCIDVMSGKFGSYGICSMGIPIYNTGRSDIIRYNDMYYMFTARKGKKADTFNSGSGDPEIAGMVSSYNSYNDGLYYTSAESIGDLASKSGLEKVPCYDDEDYLVSDAEMEFSSIIRVNGHKGTSFILMFNKWNTTDYSKSTYVWQPLEFVESSTVANYYEPQFHLYDTLTIDAYNGTVTGSFND